MKRSLPFSFRLSDDLRQQFINKSQKHGGQSAVIRTLIHAYVEDRITITPAQPTEKELLK